MKKITYIEDFTTWKEEFSFSIDIKIRFSETDMFGHMNNVSPFIYFEEARIECFNGFPKEVSHPKTFVKGDSPRVKWEMNFGRD